jgi:hypothetical protein
MHFITMNLPGIKLPLHVLYADLTISMKRISCWAGGAIALLVSLLSATAGDAAVPADVDQLLETGYCPRCDLSDADLSNLNLRDVYLSGANLAGADLSNSNLQYADLSYAILNGANLSGVDFSFANLRNASIFGARIAEPAIFRETNTEGLTMPNGNIRESADTDSSP